MSVFIGAIKKVSTLTKDQVYPRKGGIWNAPYRRYVEDDNWKKWIVYREENGKLIRVGSTYAANPKSIVHFIREVIIRDGNYVFNTGENSKVDYKYYHDGEFV